MGRNSCCVKQKLRKGLWSPEEDERLCNYVTRFGVGCWSSVPKLAGLQRCGKSCRLRWINYLRPDLKRGMFSQEEEGLIVRLHEALGNRWAQIAAQLPGRTDNEIKNFWNSCLKKKLIKQGINPNTHKPLNETSNGPTSSEIERQMYNFASKQVYDPLFLPEFQPNLDLDYYYQSSFLSQSLVRPYDEHNHVGGSFVIPTRGFDSMPDLADFDHQDMMDSRMSKCVMNQAEDGSSTFSWDGANKLDSIFRFQFDHQQSTEDFSDYSLTALPQELTGANLDVFHQI